MAAESGSGFRRDRLEPEILLYGFMRSVGRFTRSGLSGDDLMEPDQDDDPDRQVLAIEWSNAVFEALNWSVTLDERIRHESKGRDWTVGIEWKRDPSAPLRTQLGAPRLVGRARHGLGPRRVFGSP